MLKQWHKPKHHRYFDLNKQVKSLAFKQRHKLIKESLLTYYGSFEEMALCGIEGYGRAGYSVPVDTFLDGEVGGKRAYGQHSYVAFGGVTYYRPNDPIEGSSLQDLLLMVNKGYLSKERIYSTE